MSFDRERFSELAPFYVLNLLDESEKVWLDQQLAEHPELADELVEYERAVAAIPNGTREVPISAYFRYFIPKLELESAVELSEATLPSNAALEKLKLDTFPEIEWTPYPTPGVEIAVVKRDLQQREVVGLLRAMPGVEYPLHYHAAREELYLLWGDLAVGDRVYSAGECIVSEPGSTHAPYTTGGCILFFRNYVDDER